MCNGRECDTDGGPTLEPNVPYTRIKLAELAELRETMDRLDSALDTVNDKADTYRKALQRIAELCTFDDPARRYIGTLANNALNPPIPAKPGQAAV